MFAETSADASDAGESDFEMLDAFPEGMAAAAITALSSGGNRPIGEKTAGGQAKRGDGSKPGASNQKKNDRGLPSVVWIVAFLVLWSFFGKLWKNKSNRR